MKFTKEEYEKLFNKLEYTFKKSGDVLVSKIENSEDLSDADLKKLLKKLEKLIWFLGVLLGSQMKTY